MTENSKICEEIEIALYSDTELTEEQKKHIENCESCRALLSQINKMKSDLGSLSVPNIQDGQITAAVMEKIAVEKRGIPFPKFKLTHHLGTAAAIVIILAAVLVMKNPTEPDFENGSDGSEIKFSVIDENNHVLGTPATQEESAYEAEAEKPDGTQITEAEPEVQNTTLRAVTVADDGSSDEDIQNEVIDNENLTYDYSSDAVIYSLYSDGEETTEAVPEEDASANDGAAGEKLMMAPKRVTGSSGGSGGGSSAKNEAVNQAFTDQSTQDTYDTHKDAEEASLYDTEAYPESESSFIFEGIEFSLSDDDFEYNISLANTRLMELYGDGYVLSVEKLRSLGVDNKKLLELAPTITTEMFSFYSVLLDIFE